MAEVGQCGLLGAVRFLSWRGHFLVLPVCLLFCAAGLVPLTACAPRHTGDSSDASMTVSREADEPRLMFIADPADVGFGESVTLSWSAPDGGDCYASGGWNGARPSSGSFTTEGLERDTVFYLSCARGNEIALHRIPVRVAAITPDVVFETDQERVPVNGTATLHWQARGARQCTASGGWRGDVPVSGSFHTGPISIMTSFHLNCRSDAGTALATITVETLPGEVAAVRNPSSSRRS